jgi:fumarate reductase subunit D
VKQRRPIEPLLWLLFSAGGVMSALFAPVILLLFGLAFPLGWLQPPGSERMLVVAGHPLARLVIFGVCSLSLFHWAHRFRYTLYDGLQIKHLNEAINAACYGGAILGTVAAAWLVWQIP